MARGGPGGPPRGTSRYAVWLLPLAGGRATALAHRGAGAAVGPVRVASDGVDDAAVTLGLGIDLEAGRADRRDLHLATGQRRGAVGQAGVGRREAVAVRDAIVGLAGLDLRDGVTSIRLGRSVLRLLLLT